MTYTRNITREFRAASAEHREAGMRWYAEAHAEAVALAGKTGLTVAHGAALLAVLSPMLSWKRNVALAHEMADTGTGRGLGPSIRKAERILAGEAPEAVVGGEKVTAFYRNILSAGADLGVTIDRHAIDVAHGARHAEADRPSPGKRAYAAYADAYTRAARILSREIGEPVSPAQIQAVTWVSWRERHAWRKVALAA